MTTQEFIRFQDLVTLGFQAPKSDLVDFSKEDYAAAANQCSIIEKDGKALFLVAGTPVAFIFGNIRKELSEFGENAKKVLSFFAI